MSTPSSKLRLAAMSSVISLAACASPGGSGVPSNLLSQLGNALIKEVTAISAAGLADIKQLEAVASVPNPGLPGEIEDQDGLACAKAAEGVLTQINAINAAANGPGAGALTAAEIASLFAPGSPQFAQASKTLNAGCYAKAYDVVGPMGIALGGGVVGVMTTAPQILPLAAAGG